MPFQYSPFVNPYADSIGAALARQNDPAARAKEIGGQAWGHAIEQAGQIPQQIMAQRDAEQARTLRTQEIEARKTDLQQATQKRTATLIGSMAKGADSAEDFAARVGDLVELGALPKEMGAHIVGNATKAGPDGWAGLQKQYVDFAAQYAAPLSIADGGKVVNPVSGATIAENPKDAPTPTQASLAADAANPNSPTHEQSAAAVAALQGPAQTTATETARHNGELERIAGLTAGRAEASAAETARHNKAMEARPVGGSTSADPQDAAAIAEAIATGEQPPVTTGLFRLAGPVRAALAKRGFNLASAFTDWQATQKHLSTLNGAQQTRMAQAVDNAAHSLDVIDTLAGQWKGGKFPILNKANLALAKSGAQGPEAQQIATQLEAQISDVTSELGNVYMGGNSPTDHALTLAAKNLSADWSAATLQAMTKLARTNLQIRMNSMRNVGVAGASAANPYAPQPAQAPAAAPTANPDAGWTTVNGIRIREKQ